MIILYQMQIQRGEKKKEGLQLKIKVFLHMMNDYCEKNNNLSSSEIPRESLKSLSCCYKGAVTYSVF